VYRLSKSLSTKPEVSEDTEHKKILSHTALRALLHLPEERSLKEVVQVDYLPQ